MTTLGKQVWLCWPISKLLFSKLFSATDESVLAQQPSNAFRVDLGTMYIVYCSLISFLFACSASVLAFKLSDPLIQNIADCAAE